MLFVCAALERDRPRSKKLPEKPSVLYDWCGATPLLTMQKGNAVGCPICSGISSTTTESALQLKPTTSRKRRVYDSIALMDYTSSKAETMHCSCTIISRVGPTAIRTDLPMSSFLPTSPAERYFLVNARDKAKCALRCRLFDVEDASTIFIMKESQIRRDEIAEFY